MFKPLYIVMLWHSSDTDLEQKWNSLKQNEAHLEAQLRIIREYQRCINSLKIIITKDSNNQTHDTMPVNHAGDEISAESRTQQKTSLVTKIDAYLNN